MSEVIEWKKDYETGIDRIDFQHRNLLGILNDILSVPALPTDQQRTILEINLQEMVRYTYFHFDVEEEMMAKANYSGLAEHKKNHDLLKVKVSDLVLRFHQGELGIEKQIVDFLKHWLINHIGKVDMEYVPIVKPVTEAC